MLVQTEDQETYGLFLDDLVRTKIKDYAGQFENFLFSSIRSTFHVYKPTSINPKDFKKEDKNFEVGPASITRPNTKDLAPALPMCPKIILDRKKPSSSGGGSSSDDHIKRSAQPKQDSFGGTSNVLEIRLEVNDQGKVVRDIEIFML
jgi:hypothetical protein